MAVTNAAWNRQTPYETGRGYYFHDLPSAAEVRYFLWCHNAKMIPQTTAEKQVAHGADLFLNSPHRLLKPMFALDPITETIAGEEKHKPNNRNRQKFMTKCKNEPTEMKQELIEMENHFHSKSITRNAA